VSMSPAGGCDRYLIRREAASRGELLARGFHADELRARPWPAAVHAYAIGADGVERPVMHIARHSPDGFEFGYGGSGPADLARSILVDYFGLHDAPDALPVPYQAFKWRFVARADRNASSFEISRGAIDEWVTSHVQLSEVPRCPHPHIHR
jgi:hypothetical protein